MPQIDDTTASVLATPTDAMASPIAGGRAYLADVARRLAPACVRSQSRDRVLTSLRSLRREAARQPSWHVADVCGGPTPDGFQALLNRAEWDANAVRDELRTYRLQHLGDANGVLVLDETGGLNKGQHSAGVARQDTGIVGTVEHCPMGVLLSSASPLGHALVEREVDRPAQWAHHRARCRQAGIPADQPLAPTPQLACQMWARACAAGLPATWVPGARVYGGDRRLRRGREARPQA